MLDFLIPKTKLQAYDLFEISIKNFEIIGIAQINPHCAAQFGEDIFLTVVNFANETKQYDEREGLVLAKYFTVKKCPRCKKNQLVPTKIRINTDSVYLAHEEEIAFDAYEEHPSRRHRPSIAEAYCNHCSTCFEARIKTKDAWIKEAKKLRAKDLITGEWVEYCID